MINKGQIISERYEIVRSIGEGGMANVYLAHDVILDRDVAIKVLRGDLADDEKFIRRFKREALSASNLSHPNIIKIYDVGEEHNKYYIVMEYAPGKSLKQLIKKRKKLTLPEVIDIMLQITAGLAHAHDSYIIHRDIKPQNIMIMEDGSIKIMDFGIAMALNDNQLTQTNSVMGSVHYLPPEQATGKGSTIKSDIYSLGVLMFELVTGKIPFKGESAVEIALKQMKEPLPSVKEIDSDIPQSIENIILKAAAKNPKNRYESVRAMYQDLKTALDESRKKEKRIVYEFKENDLEETKVMNPVKVDALAQKIDNKKESSNKLIVVLSSIFVFLVAVVFSILIILPKVTEVPDIKIPDVSSQTIIAAEEELKGLGFEVALDIEEVYSDSVDEGLIVKTDPSVGRTVKEGTQITLYKSIGSLSFNVLDYTGENYTEIKYELENTYEINVLIEKQEVDDPENYESTEVIDQSPLKGAVLEPGDTLTLYIPNIVYKYPDMVGEGWTLSDAEMFSEEYSLILLKEYQETDSVLEGTILAQSREAGTNIVEGYSFKVIVATSPEIEEETIGEETANE